MLIFRKDAILYMVSLTPESLVGPPQSVQSGTTNKISELDAGIRPRQPAVSDKPRIGRGSAVETVCR